MILRLKKRLKQIVSAFQVMRFCKRKGIWSASNQISLKASYGKQVRIGENVIITDDVSIGDYSYVNRNSNIENCSIGKYCSISEGVKINPIEHNLTLVTTHPIAGEQGHYGQENEPVVIGNDVLISLNAIILSGVKIGNGAVIAAGAVVTKDVPEYAVVGGVPAKVIRYRFDEKRIRDLQALEWWNWSDNKMKANIEFLRGETEEIIDEYVE